MNADPKDQPDDFDDVASAIDDRPINIDREAQELIEDWGLLAPQEAHLKAKYCHMAGDEDKASDWLEVKRVTEERLKFQPGSHTWTISNTVIKVAERIERAKRSMAGALLFAAALVSSPAQSASTQPMLIHDGSHDFDFLIGDWSAHLRRMIDRKTGVTTSDPRTGTWVEYDGVCNDKKLLDTNANFEQFDVQASGTHLRFRGQALRMYDPASHQWSIYGLDLDKGELGLPPLIGQFAGKRGEFFDSELRNGRMVQVRYVWSNVTPKSARMEQSFSPDGGKSWAVNWIVDLSR